MLTLPTTHYTVYVDFGPKIGIGSADFVQSLDDAADEVANCAALNGVDAAYRVLRIELDHNNLPESVADVTDQVADVLARREAQWAAE